jgi:hypothetical protein
MCRGGRGVEDNHATLRRRTVVFDLWIGSSWCTLISAERKATLHRPTVVLERFGGIRGGNPDSPQGERETTNGYSMQYNASAVRI